MNIFLWNKTSISFIPMRGMCLWCLIIKRKEIIMWINIYPIERLTLILKIVQKEVFPMKPKHQYRLSQWGECIYGAQSWKEVRLLCESMFPNWKMNFNAKNDRKWSFSYNTKASTSFITMRRMCLQCPMMKRKEIIMWIHVNPNWKMNFDSKNRRKRGFS